MRLWLIAGLVGCTEYSVGDPREGDTGPLPDDTGPSEPVADAGLDRSVQPLDEVLLDARSSYDPAGRPLVAVRWELVTAPEGSRATLEEPERPTAAFVVDLAGTYVLSLTVQNQEGRWDSTPDEVVITAVPADGFYVELSWDAASDLDLHLLDGTTPLFGRGDCSYCNPNPRWAEPGPGDDPSLDRDAIFGFGPETVTIDQPASGRFEIAVHYYGEDGFHSCRGTCEPSPAVVRIYLGGALEAIFEQTLSSQGDLWRVAEIGWPDRTIGERDRMGHTEQTGCP